MPASPPRIAVFRALQLGDLLCAVPALCTLRAGFPSAHISLVGLPWARAFVARYAALIDELILFPGAVGFPEQEQSDAGLPRLAAELRGRGLDLAIQMHGSGGAANDIVLQWGAGYNAGFRQPGERRAGCFIPWPDELPEARRYTRLTEALGLGPGDDNLWFPLTGADRAEAHGLLQRHGVHPERAVIVHAGSQLPSRRWPPERFARVADALALRGWNVLLTGTQAEADLVDSVRQRMGGAARRSAISLAGATSLGGLAALVAAAPLVVCNDTGISHIAAAVGTPSVVVALGSDTRRWAPLDAARHRVIADYPACRPCAYAVCPVGHPCALNVTPAQVIAAAMEQLQRRRAPARGADAAGAQRVKENA
ncbi:MAG TPA: glycosyltransferase family 9 protein [Burkholderiales bacterium]|nr:glycosyltransferase family 9 protein [Burkholderiales bacterium]